MNEKTIAESATPIRSSRDALDLWSTMWNTDGEIARRICAEDFRIHFAVTEPCCRG